MEILDERNPGKSGLQKRFFFGWTEDDEWFKTGLLIASAADDVVLPSLRHLDRAFAGIAWDLLGKKELPHAFRNKFLLKRALGGFRLLMAARNRYDLVAICWPKTQSLRQLRIYAWFAFLVMRPQRFFIVTEAGNGFWLAIDNAEAVRWHFQTLTWIWDRLAVSEKNIFYRAWNRLVQFARIILGLAMFLSAAMLLIFLRSFYETKTFRYKSLGIEIGPPPRALRRKMNGDGRNFKPTARVH